MIFHKGVYSMSYSVPTLIIPMDDPQEFAQKISPAHRHLTVIFSPALGNLSPIYAFAFYIY